MRVTVDLPPQALRRLEIEAARRDGSIDDVIAELAAALPGPRLDGRRNPAFVTPLTNDVLHLGRQM